MDGIFFLLLAFFTVVASINLSNYGDILSKQSSIKSSIIGGILIASITSLPEFVTSISASILDNPSLSFGDILGSNFFNIFSLAVFNILFIKRKVFKNISKTYFFECIILTISYIFIRLGSLNIFSKYISIVLFIFYIIYIFLIINRRQEVSDNYKQDKYVKIKFILTSFLMIIFSIFLTLEADKISRVYPNFSSSTVGAILLGITTSLPEVVTTFELIKLNNYDMAASNILGSNIFNFLVLGVSDYFIKGKSIYSFSDKYSYLYLLGGFISTLLILLMIIINKKSIFNNIISIIIIIFYLIVWYLQFI